MRKLPVMLLLAVVATAFINVDTASADPHHRPSAGPLSGKRIMVSPGHGWTWQNSSLFWYTQRGVTNGMVEDFSNAMLAIDFLVPYLINAGADVVVPRERSYQPIEFIGDDGDAAYFETGSWTSSVNVSGYWGSGYRWASTSATETATAGWDFNIAQAGRYPVYVRWTQGTDRATDALYRVHHGAGVSEVRLDQNQHSWTSPWDGIPETAHQGGRWVFLGEWEFTPASGARIELSNASTNGSVVVIDACKLGGGMGDIDRGGGTTGRPRWEECSRYYAEFHGFPSSVWDVAGSDDGTDNVSTPPRMLKEWKEFDLAFALHSNASGGSGTARGTVTYTYDNSGSTQHPQALLDASVDYATLVQNEVMRVCNDWAAANSDTWNNRGLNTANFGELRTNTKTPSCLLEMAFHDNAQDAWYIRQPGWRHDVARAIYKAIVRYFDANAVIMPLPPTHLSMRNTGSGQLTLSWQAQADPLEASATPTGYRVYLSDDGVAFDDGRDANGASSHLLSGLAPGELKFARVTALNAGGESLWSEVVCARTPDAQAQGLPTPLLLVAGYDRLDEFTWYQQGATNRTGDMHIRNQLDSLVRHALSAAQATTVGGGSYFFDSASNEAVETGGVSLGSYAVVDWVLGNESTTDETFSATEQTLVASYLANDGRLFVSGAEIGWDLDAQGGTGDRAFYNGPLETNYVGDSSNDWGVEAVAGALFNGLAPFDFDDGSGSSYSVGYPDVIEPASGAASVPVLEYSLGVTAGVASANVVVFGFPFETINQQAARYEIMQRVLRSLAPSYTGVNPTPPASGSTGGSGGDDDSGCAVGASGVAPVLIGLFAILAWRRRR
ncbi:MAG: N-acetylmuramoyl-L-alanine amidase [Planctomycetes bacterium]|nr:N-acetylmuramoyl-L-alanine amidase [Planctomycetota bacterium]MCB9934724.1 N-acetylmuramoyl-L-alanine amidase [Planctomycetota bacterium]